jgi:lipopolysaccharide export system permease protein
MELKKIDKYLIRQFIQTTLFGLIAFIFIFVIIDLMEHMDDFIDQNVPTQIIVEYYIVFVPEIIRLMLPVAVLLSGLFTTGKMSNQNEITAMKSSGISLYRYIAPFLITGLLFSAFAIFFGGYIVPSANKHKVKLEREYLRTNIYYSGSKIHFQDSQTRIVTISYFDASSERANDISIQEFEKTDPTKMISRIDADKMKYDSSKSTWELKNVNKRVFINNKVKLTKLKELSISDLSFKPEDILKKQRRPEELTLTELKDYAVEQKRTGNDPTRIEIEYHSRIAFAFAAFIVILFGVPLSVNKRKGGLAIQFGLSLLITFIYLVCMKIFQAFGKNGVLDPILTAWSANILFFIAGSANLDRVRK